MRIIRRFAFAVEDVVEIQMPEFSTILHAEVQDSQHCLWAIVDTDQPMVTVRFHLVKTGNPTPGAASKQSHVATLKGIHFVRHLFLAE